MIQKPMDVLREFPIRKNEQQKLNFRGAVVKYMSELGYICKTEKGSYGGNNLIIGDPSQASYLITAHYDTCARMFLPNLITPCNFWTFLGYQIFITLLMMAIPVLPAIWIGQLSTFETGYFAWYFGFICLALLMMCGPANPSNANDNTSGVVTVLEIARSLPIEHRNKVCFVLFDLEEQGLLGSRSYRKAHKAETNHQIILNMDCVGDGNEMMIFPTKKLSKDPNKMQLLRKLPHANNGKSLSLHEKGFSVYPSDQRNFPYGAGFAAFKRKKGIGLYCDKIHTSRDTVLDENNVNMLRDRIIAAITE